MVANKIVLLGRFIVVSIFYLAKRQTMMKPNGPEMMIEIKIKEP